MDRPSRKDMWKVIEDFGLDRDLIDPREDLSYGEVRGLYEEIKSHEKSAAKQSLSLHADTA